MPVIGQQLLDPVPVPLVFGAFVVVALLVHEAGFRFGHWRQTSTPDEREGPTGMLVGAILALVAFLLAVVTGMASTRFDNRRSVVLDEANAIGTTYLRAGLLDEPAAGQIRDLLKAYVPLRIAAADRATYDANEVRSQELLTRIWAIAEPIGRAHPDSPIVALFIDSLNATIDVNETRQTALIYARVPESVVGVLVVGSILALAMVGYNAGLLRRRGFVSAVVLVVALGSVLTLVVDLDRPRDGLVQVNQQPLRDLEQQIGIQAG